MSNSMEINYNSIFFGKKERRNIWDMPVHDHNYDEIYYLVDGNVNYFIDNKSYKLKTGCMAFIPGGALHKTYSGDDFYHNEFVMNFPRNFLNEKLREKLMDEIFNQPIILIPEKQRAKIEKIFIGIESEKKCEDEYSLEIIKGYVYQLAAILFRIGSEELNFISEIRPDYIVRVREYIEENYNEDIKLLDVTKLTGYSETYISRKFKELYGVSFSNYINIYRITKAVEFLQQTDDTITNIAIKCGFENSNYFCKVFREIKGITPHQYRIEFNKAD